MKLGGCSRQSELRDVVLAGRWPHACDPALRAHAAECRSCADFVLVAATLHQARADASSQAPLASPGALWWRAQVRRRNRAVEQMARPIVLAEVTAFVCTVAALGFSLWRWNQVTDWSYSLAGWFSSMFSSSDSVASFSGWVVVLAVAASVTLLLFGGFAVYLLAKKE